MWGFNRVLQIQKGFQYGPWKLNRVSKGSLQFNRGFERVLAIHMRGTTVVTRARHCRGGVRRLLDASLRLRDDEEDTVREMIHLRETQREKEVRDKVRDTVRET
jgi:hypothetical protein